MAVVTEQPGAKLQEPENDPLLKTQKTQKSQKSQKSQRGAGSQWMPAPQPSDGVPPGLEYLAAVDRIIIDQLIEKEEILLGYHTENRYILRNSAGERVYYAFEESSFASRKWCDARRGFTMHVLDNCKNEVIRVKRPFKCFGGGCSGNFAGPKHCSHECRVEAPPGCDIGKVIQRHDWCASSFLIKDAEGLPILKIDGPFPACGRKVAFPVSTPTGFPVGEITKKWRGPLVEFFTNADRFSVWFPKDLDIKSKVLLLGATFMIDFMEFESDD